MNDLTDTQQLINDFLTVQRSHYIPKTDVRENDVIHSMSVAFLAWQIHDKLSLLNLDLGKILQYALAHDLVEVYAGDVNTYASDEKRMAKKKVETISLARIEKEMRSSFPTLAPVIKSYENRGDEEALFVWSVDKIQALVQGKLDNYRPFYEQGLTTADVRRVHGGHLSQVHPKVHVLYRDVLKWFLDEYDDEAIKKDGVLIAHNRAARQ